MANKWKLVEFLSFGEVFHSFWEPVACSSFIEPSNETSDGREDLPNKATSHRMI
jgi:hypothetical protein